MCFIRPFLLQQVHGRFDYDSRIEHFIPSNIQSYVIMFFLKYWIWYFTYCSFLHWLLAGFLGPFLPNSLLFLGKSGHWDSLLKSPSQTGEGFSSLARENRSGSLALMALQPQWRQCNTRDGARRAHDFRCQTSGLAFKAWDVGGCWKHLLSVFCKWQSEEKTALFNTACVFS